MRIIFTFLCFSLLHSPAFSQSSNLSFSQLSRPEKWWVIFHPFIANSARKITDEARKTSEEMKRDTTLDGDSNGGQVDAFRHAYWMASLSGKFCYRKALSLGKAHEKGDYQRFKRHLTEEGTGIPDSASGVMDLFNNEVGVVIRRENRNVSNDSLKIIVKNAILTGRLKKISKNLKGQPLDCDGKIVDLLMYRFRWNIPQCLVTSAFPRID